MITFYSKLLSTIFKTYIISAITITSIHFSLVQFLRMMHNIDFLPPPCFLSATFLAILLRFRSKIFIKPPISSHPIEKSQHKLKNTQNPKSNWQNRYKSLQIHQNPNQISQIGRNKRLIQTLIKIYNTEIGGNRVLQNRNQRKSRKLSKNRGMKNVEI